MGASVTANSGSRPWTTNEYRSIDQAMYTILSRMMQWQPANPQAHRWDRWHVQRERARGYMRRINLVSWSVEVRRCEWRWSGHVARQAGSWWTNRASTWEPLAVERRGRPQLKWNSHIVQFLAQRETEWPRAANNRGRVAGAHGRMGVRSHPVCASARGVTLEWRLRIGGRARTNPRTTMCRYCFCLCLTNINCRWVRCWVVFLSCAVLTSM